MARSWQNFAARRGIKDMVKVVRDTGARTYEELKAYFDGIGVEPPSLDSVKDAFDSLFPPPPPPEPKTKATKKETSEATAQATEADPAAT
jgi:hypothetical protein